MYSIASSQEEVDDEVHLTVRTVRYGKDDKDYQGAASGFLADHIEEGDDVKIFIEPNRSFRLPENGDTPIIMIGAGTGIAPFRAFVQDRQAKGEKGKNWLIFGNQRFTEDFLYQSEWIQSHQAGFLPKYDFAWSRQGDKKEYVQHKLAQRSQDVWQWLQEGAHIYLCGDANRMAKDVENTLIDIISKEGKLSVEDAEDYLDELREEKRYQRDVY
jgi:sulfite reductase (NADPH) flavoprotein alpha-component